MNRISDAAKVLNVWDGSADAELRVLFSLMDSSHRRVRDASRSARETSVIPAIQEADNILLKMNAEWDTSPERLKAVWEGYRRHLELMSPVEYVKWLAEFNTLTGENSVYRRSRAVKHLLTTGDARRKARMMYAVTVVQNAYSDVCLLNIDMPMKLSLADDEGTENTYTLPSVEEIARKLISSRTANKLIRKGYDVDVVVSQISNALYLSLNWEKRIHDVMYSTLACTGVIVGSVKESTYTSTVVSVRNALERSDMEMGDAVSALTKCYRESFVKKRSASWDTLLDFTDLPPPRECSNSKMMALVMAMTLMFAVMISTMPHAEVEDVSHMMNVVAGGMVVILGPIWFTSVRRSLGKRYLVDVVRATSLAMYIRKDIEIGLGIDRRRVAEIETATEPVDETFVARITAVNNAVDQLDREWLDYTLDTEAYFLTKPLLRCMEVDSTRHYREAVYALREACAELLPTSTEDAVIEAERLAEEALLAWGVANDHALRVGVSEMTVTERSALRRLKALVSQLEDPSTPRPMWASLADAISREMSKLVTVPVSWKDLNVRKALEGRVAPQLMSSVLGVKEETTYA